MVLRTELFTKSWLASPEPATSPQVSLRPWGWLSSTQRLDLHSPLGKTGFQAGFSTEYIGGLSVGCTLGGDSRLGVLSFHQSSALNHAFCKSAGKNKVRKTRDLFAFAWPCDPRRSALLRGRMGSSVLLPADCVTGSLMRILSVCPHDSPGKQVSLVSVRNPEEQDVHAVSHGRRRRPCAWLQTEGSRDGAAGAA